MPERLQGLGSAVGALLNLPAVLLCGGTVARCDGSSAAPLDNPGTVTFSDSTSHRSPSLTPTPGTLTCARLTTTVASSTAETPLNIAAGDFTKDGRSDLVTVDPQQPRTARALQRRWLVQRSRQRTHDARSRCGRRRRLQRRRLAGPGRGPLRRARAGLPAPLAQHHQSRVPEGERVGHSPGKHQRRLPDHRGGKLAPRRPQRHVQSGRREGQRGEPGNCSVNQGSGTFAATTLNTVGQEPFRSAAADVDKDGNLDIGLATVLGLNGTHTGDFEVLQGNRSGPFLLVQALPLPNGVTESRGLAVGDCNADGKTDEAISGGPT